MLLWYARQAKICPYVPSTQGRIGQVHHTLIPFTFISPCTPDKFLALGGQLARFAGITADDVVLDIGCGDGRALLALAETVGCKGVGIDIDPELVEIAACAARAAEASSPAVASRLRYESADMCAPAGPPGEYDAEGPTASGQRSAAVNKLDEYFMADGVTVVLIYLIADALVLLYPHLQAAIQAHIGRQQRRPGDMIPTVRVVTQVYHYDFGGAASFFATDGTTNGPDDSSAREPGTRSATPAQTPGEASTVGLRDGDDGTAKSDGTAKHDDPSAPAAKDVAWKLLMYTDAVFRSHPAAGDTAATVQKISAHQVRITHGPR